MGSPWRKKSVQNCFGVWDSVVLARKSAWFAWSDACNCTFSLWKSPNCCFNVEKQSLADFSELLVVFVTFFKDFFWRMGAVNNHCNDLCVFPGIFLRQWVLPGLALGPFLAKKQNTPFFFIPKRPCTFKNSAKWSPSSPLFNDIFTSSNQLVCTERPK